jgi:hypothetical protein
MNANMAQVYEITRQRIAASQEAAVRALVRTNAMLSDEVDRLQAEVAHLRAITPAPPPRVCAGQADGPRATGDVKREGDGILEASNG